MICSVTGCSKNRQLRRGMCNPHYRRFIKYGDYNMGLVAPYKASAEEKLLWYGWIVAENGCWITSIGLDADGYSHIVVNGARTGAHRLAYEAWVGPIPDGMVVRHKVCDNPPCINPEHLAVGTHADNMQDRQEHGRTARGSRSGTSKLTEKEVADIRAKYATGKYTYEVLAAHYNVTHGLIGHIIRELVWTTNIAYQKVRMLG